MRHKKIVRETRNKNFIMPFCKEILDLELDLEKGYTLREQEKMRLRLRDGKVYELKIK